MFHVTAAGYSVDVLYLYRHLKAAKMMDKFLIKELAIVDIGTGAGSSWIFRPPGGSCVQPIDVERANTFTSKNLHGMEWGTGDIPYSMIPNIIQQYILDDMWAPLPLYVKGEEKARLLRELLRNNPEFQVVNIEKIGFLRKLEQKAPEICLFHSRRNKPLCAKTQAFNIRHLVLEYGIE
ncbi:unnamed protein product [Nesidiocoris tenuis]|uniref:Uncharacterized protein n=1 Tax=Nesidiocoris tenuis TaxID=355587 RepID=A0A6H5GQ34_9HEMI|nr:unnamed protein product [Nesidiocoris tenuis]CAB0003889.1 unnamed protein product [Nesidiocoris tenuis]